MILLSISADRIFEKQLVKSHSVFKIHYLQNYSWLSDANLNTALDLIRTWNQWQWFEYYAWLICVKNRVMQKRTINKCACNILVLMCLLDVSMRITKVFQARSTCIIFRLQHLHEKVTRISVLPWCWFLYYLD